MKRLILFLIMFFATIPAEAWTEAKFNFRATSDYCTDGANETYVLNESYPTTRGGFTFGWVTPASTADRTSSQCTQFAGIHYTENNNVQRTFIVDLPSTGTYNIKVAAGDPNSGQEYQYFRLYDDTSVISTCADADGTAENHYTDASCADTTYASWSTSNTAVTHAFTSTTFKITIGSPDTQSASTTLTHLEISLASTDILPLLQAIEGE